MILTVLTAVAIAAPKKEEVAPKAPTEEVVADAEKAPKN